MSDIKVSGLTATENVVAPIWAELLQRPSVDPDDNFFAHGGDSMMMMIAQFRVAEELKIELQPGAISSAPTLREFCALIDDVRSSLDGEPAQLTGAL